MRRILIVSCVLASAAVLVAGCGGKPWSEAVTAANPSARLLAAVQHTTDAHTADFTMSIKMSASVPGAGSQNVSMSGDGQMDFTNQSAAMTVKASAGGQDQQVEMRVVAGKLYVNVLGNWTEASPNGISQSGGRISASGGDPTQYLEYLDGVSSDVHVVGNEPIDGVDTTEYAGTIDVQNLLSSPDLSASQREKLRTSLDTLGASIPPMPFTAWIDDQSRLRKMNMSMDVSAESAHVHMDMTIGFSNFGVSVNVQPPPGFEHDTATTTTVPTALGRARDRATQSDLRNALTAEKVEYTDNEHYSASVDDMATIEGSLDWGGSLHVGVSTDKQSVCVWETSKSGATFSLADVATGSDAGTYFGDAKCPQPVTAKAAAALNAAWGTDSSDNSGDNSNTNDGPAAQSDLRNALTAEKTIYTDNQMYTSDTKQLREVENTLAWGTKVHVYVADAVDTGDKGVVCMWELDIATGKNYAIADVAAGPDAGTYFGTTPCPPSITPTTLSSADFNTGW